jgi:predicted nucleotidyltransferase
MECLGDLPKTYQSALKRFVDGAKTALGADLASAVLFGSAAEGRIRVTSDVNLILVLKRFDLQRVAAIREAYRTARASVNLQIMLMLEAEIATAAEVFAVKFADIEARRRVLYGPDVFASISIPTGAIRQAIQQSLLNLKIRLRERYALVSLREDRLAVALADSAAPLRTCASALLRLEGRPASSPKEALETLAADLHPNGFPDLLQKITEARTAGKLPAGEAELYFARLIDLTDAIQRRAEQLP